MHFCQAAGASGRQGDDEDVLQPRPFRRQRTDQVKGQQLGQRKEFISSQNMGPLDIRLINSPFFLCSDFL